MKCYNTTCTCSNAVDRFHNLFGTRRLIGLLPNSANKLQPERSCCSHMCALYLHKLGIAWWFEYAAEGKWLDTYHRLLK